MKRAPREPPDRALTQEERIQLTFPSVRRDLLDHFLDIQRREMKKKKNHSVLLTTSPREWLNNRFLYNMLVKVTECVFRRESGGPFPRRVTRDKVTNVWRSRFGGPACVKSNGTLAR